MLFPYYSIKGFLGVTLYYNYYPVFKQVGTNKDNHLSKSLYKSFTCR